MKTRYTLNEDGFLADRDGQLLGRVLSITIESGGEGADVKASSTATAEKEETVDKEGVSGKPKSTPEAQAIDRVWKHYLELIPSKRQLDDKRRRIIRQALKLVGEEMVKLAITGLSRSPWHNGDNPERKKYLDLRYALKGIGDESDDERIEKAISWAANYAPDAKPVDEAKVNRSLEQIRYTLSLSHRPDKERAADAWRWLKENGFTVVRLEVPPWARIER